MSEKRKHQGAGAQGGDARKKKKAQYFTGREWQAGKEMVNVLEEVWEELSGKSSEHASRSTDGEAADGGGQGDIAAMLEEELGELRDNTKARFWRIDTGCKCLTFIKWVPQEGDPSPGQIVLHILEAAEKTKVTKTRHCSRLFPVEVTAYAALDKITAAVAPLIERELPTGEDQPVFTWGIQYEYRANDSLDRKEVIDSIAALVPKRHHVDLNSADKTILVQIIKTTCTLSVLPRFRGLARYNLQTLTDPKQGAQKGKTDVKDSTKAEAVASQDLNKASRDRTDVEVVEDHAGEKVKGEDEGEEKGET